MQYTVGLYTLGCKVSQYETEAIGEAFEDAGFFISSFDDRCDVYVINTCTVTRESDRKSRQVIRRARKTNPDAVVMVIGCYAQTTPSEIAAIEGVAYISGTDGKMRLPTIARELLSSRPHAPIVDVTPLDGVAFEPMCIRRAPRTRAYVKIEDGCECFCTYCAIPGARGSVRSKQPDDVLREIETLVRGGTEEIVLTGIEAASYGVDLDGFRLIDLVERIERESDVKRIRFGSLTPELMKPQFIERIARATKVVPHFHLSMQSGSDAILRLMKRRYNTTQALTALSRLREAMPDVTFTTDMMVGFPGETDDLFLQTLDFTRQADFLDMHVFAYSRRPGTPAATYPSQVPEQVKRERSATLIALKNELRQRHFEAYVAKGAALRVLFETEENGVFTGHSDAFVPVSVKSNAPLHGCLAWVMPQSVGDDGLFGVLTDENI